VQWAVWDSARLRKEVQQRLIEKESKQLKGGPYDEYIVLVHTDEPGLAIDQVETWLADFRFATPKQMDRAFLLLSYDPSRRGYPYVQLRSYLTSRGDR
jgi:hypothetical protein